LSWGSQGGKGTSQRFVSGDKRRRRIEKILKPFGIGIETRVSGREKRASLSRKKRRVSTSFGAHF